MSAFPGQAIRVEVAFSPRAGEMVLIAISQPVGATVSQALRASGLLSRHPELQEEGRVRMGIWGTLCSPSTVLRDQDRIELYRGLMVDPKEARRIRHRRARHTPG